MVLGGEPFIGTASELLAILHNRPSYSISQSTLPKRANHLSGELKRLKTELRQAGVVVEIGRGKERFIRLYRVGEQPPEREQRRSGDDKATIGNSRNITAHRGYDDGDDGVAYFPSFTSSKPANWPDCHFSHRGNKIL